MSRSLISNLERKGIELETLIKFLRREILSISFELAGNYDVFDIDVRPMGVHPHF